ncbi:MAG TPA: hypothetical protein DCM28_05190 [Phycisphaerales bacterium]|nr:hypothetical protein [Phycisphaerales bacterium]HCD32292.1 hypothetical protein [Phycisphaerales bacterium]|tara:strand:+ start:599 stop:1075 length:477 start_codon:yes stop_codon:yes gene_type:complete
MTVPAEPWGQVLTALWNVLESRSGFTSLVKPGNRIRFDNRIRKSTLQAADVPLVAVVADAVDPHMFRTSNGSSFKRQFRFEIYTGEVDITAQAFPVEWQIMLAVASIGNRLDGLDFVRSVRPVQGQAPGADPEGKSNGWYTVIGVEVEVWFDTASLQS